MISEPIVLHLLGDRGRKGDNLEPRSAGTDAHRGHTSTGAGRGISRLSTSVRTHRKQNLRAVVREGIGRERASLTPNNESPGSYQLNWRRI